MKIRLISFTENGEKCAATIADALEKSGHECRSYALPKYAKDCDVPLDVSASDWAKEGFMQADALIFCCAAGIAVRAIAPLVFDKTRDPAVIVVDEKGRFVIPILSGHIGGANELAHGIAEITGGQAVISTATDINGLFAVDVFAKKNNLKICDMSLAKDVSAALLRGEKVGFYSDVPFEGVLPHELTTDEARLGIAVTARDISPFEITLRLIPKSYAVGIGCKKGKSFSELYGFLQHVLCENGIKADEIRAIASIDIKKDESGLTELCKTLDVPFVTYSADELNSAKGEFSESDFVRETTGTPCVCERAAALASCGEPVLRKVSEDGKTIAIWKYKEELCFD